MRETIEMAVFIGFALAFTYAVWWLLLVVLWRWLVGLWHWLV